MDPRAPNLFVIGAPKAGTTFVHHALAKASATYMSPVKEPGFFSSSRDYRLGLDYYLNAYFDGAAGFAHRGESTPWYLYSAEACERIASLPWVEPPKFIVLVRQPSGRAYSMYNDRRRSNREDRPFAEAIESELDALERGVVETDVRRRYVWCGMYAEHIERWQNTFGADQVHIEIFESLDRDADRGWKELDHFLGDDLGPSRFSEVSERDKNRGGELRWPRLDAMLRSFEGRNSSVVEQMKRRVRGRHRRVLQRIGQMNRTGSGTPTPPGQEIMARIDEYCRPATERLEVILGHPIDAWKRPDYPSDPTRR